MKKRDFLKFGAKAGLVASIAPTVLLQACGNAEQSSSDSATSDQMNMLSGGFTLPELAFGYAEYEEAVDAMTMEIHHSKHHQGYVNKLNKALEQEPLAANSLVELLQLDQLPTAVRNNGGGHFNRSDSCA